MFLTTASGEETEVRIKTIYDSDADNKKVINVFSLSKPIEECELRLTFVDKPL